MGLDGLVSQIMSFAMASSTAPCITLKVGAVSQITNLSEKLRVLYVIYAVNMGLEFE